MAKKKKATTGKSAGAGLPEAFLASLEHPLRDVILALRPILLRADRRLTEGIKWNAPSYSLEGEDRVTFNLRAKDQVRLIFHRGAKVKDSQAKGPLIDDPDGLLEWAADDRAIAAFASVDEVTTQRAALTTILKRWLAATCEPA